MKKATKKRLNELLDSLVGVVSDEEQHLVHDLRRTFGELRREFAEVKAEVEQVQTARRAIERRLEEQKAAMKDTSESLSRKVQASEHTLDTMKRHFRMLLPAAGSLAQLLFTTRSTKVCPPFVSFHPSEQVHNRAMHDEVFKTALALQVIHTLIFWANDYDEDGLASKVETLDLIIEVESSDDGESPEVWVYTISEWLEDNPGQHDWFDANVGQTCSACESAATSARDTRRSPN